MNPLALLSPLALSLWDLLQPHQFYTLTLNHITGHKLPVLLPPSLLHPLPSLPRSLQSNRTRPLPHRPLPPHLPTRPSIYPLRHLAIYYNPSTPQIYHHKMHTLYDPRHFPGNRGFHSPRKRSVTSLRSENLQPIAPSSLLSSQRTLGPNRHHRCLCRTRETIKPRPTVSKGSF